MTSTRRRSRWPSSKRRSRRRARRYEFHSYEGAGHAFFSVNRPAYRPEAAMDGWQKIFAFYGKYLAA